MNNHTANHKAPDTTPDAVTSYPRILIVDDDDVTRGLHEIVLSKAGYGTESVSNGKEALLMLATADFDLVLTDRNMPLLDGTGLIRTLRAAGCRIPVMMVSGSLAGGGELPDDVRKEVAVALPKPTSLRELLAGVARSLGWRPAMLGIPCTA